jgi:hypothetical protein
MRLMLTSGSAGPPRRAGMGDGFGAAGEMITRTAKHQEATAGRSCGVCLTSQKSSPRISRAILALGTFLHVPGYYGLKYLHAGDSSAR